MGLNELHSEKRNGQVVMKNKLKIFFYLIVGILLLYEGCTYFNFKSNSYLGVRGGEMNHYKNNFDLIVNDKSIDTINVNIPSPFSKGLNLSLGKNTIQLRSLDSDIGFEKDVYFYGIFTYNIIEVTSTDFLYSRSYSLPVTE